MQKKHLLYSLRNLKNNRILSSALIIPCMSVLFTQLCLTLWNPMDCSPPGSSVHEILEARILEWVAIPFSRGSSWPRDQTRGSCIAGRFFTTWATILLYLTAFNILVNVGVVLTYPILISIGTVLSVPGNAGTVQIDMCTGSSLLVFVLHPELFLRVIVNCVPCLGTCF